MLYPDLNDGEFDLTVYVPTKGRPDKIYDHETNFYSTSTINTRVVYIVSSNDPRKDDYFDVSYIGDKPLIITPDKPGFVDPLNKGYQLDRRSVYSYAVGFMGDDHFPRTQGWDQQLVEQLIKMKSGLVYANDGFQGENIPTQIAMTSDIPLALGYMTLPQLWHLYADNFWLDLGKALDKISYLPEVLIEHMHPATGKVASDVGYEFSGSFELDMRDKIAYTKYIQDDLDGDVRNILGMLRRTGKL